jgi:hypothetical protein
MEITQDSVSEERIAALEKRVRDMDALVKGLVNELLDIKSVAMTMTRQAGKSGAAELHREPVPGPSAAPSVSAAPDGSTIIRQKEIGRAHV